MTDPNMELIRQLREAMEEEGFTPTTTNGWIGTVSDVARLAREHSRLTAALQELQRLYRPPIRGCAEDVRLQGVCPECVTYNLVTAALSAEAGDTDA
jgi:hypothetical protein